MEPPFNIFDHLPELGEVMEKWRQMYARDESPDPASLVLPDSEEVKALFEAMTDFTFSESPNILVGVVEMFQSVFNFLNFLHMSEVDLQHVTACMYAVRGFGTHFLRMDSIHNYIQGTLNIIGEIEQETLEHIMAHDPKFSEALRRMYRLGDGVIRDYQEHKKDCPCGGQHTWVPGGEKGDYCARCFRDYPDQEKEE